MLSKKSIELLSTLEKIVACNCHCAELRAYRMDLSVENYAVTIFLQSLKSLSKTFPFVKLLSIAKSPVSLL